MDERVESEYRRLVSKAVVRNGSLVSESASSFGWGDYESDYDGSPFRGSRHSTRCGIATMGRLVEDACWYEFMGTFYEGDNRVYGMEVEGVTCNCGKIANRTFRWAAPIGEAIKTVMMELLEGNAPSSGD